MDEGSRCPVMAAERGPDGVPAPTRSGAHRAAWMHRIGEPPDATPRQCCRPAGGMVAARLS
jgi:hypothetical protein